MCRTCCTPTTPFKLPVSTPSSTLRSHVRTAAVVAAPLVQLCRRQRGRHAAEQHCEVAGCDDARVRGMHGAQLQQAENGEREECAQACWRVRTAAVCFHGSLPTPAPRIQPAHLRAREQQHPQQEGQLPQEQHPQLRGRHGAAGGRCRRRRRPAVQLEVAAEAGAVGGSQVARGGGAAGRVQQAGGGGAPVDGDLWQRQPRALPAQLLGGPGAAGGAVEGAGVGGAGAAAARGAAGHPAAGVPSLMAAQRGRLRRTRGTRNRRETGAGNDGRQRAASRCYARYACCVPRTPTHLPRRQRVAVRPGLAAEVAGQRVDGKQAARGDRGTRGPWGEGTGGRGCERAGAPARGGGPACGTRCGGAALRPP